MKEEVSIRLITHSADLPDLQCEDFFHSVQFFHILEDTPRQKPCMAIATNGQGQIVGQMLAVISFHRSLLPPVMYSHCHVYGEGVYAHGLEDKESVFAMLLKAISEYCRHHLCLFVEFSDLSSKMFGYGTFRENGYFPIQWQKIHNSLHSKAPEERVSDKTLAKIEYAEQKGVTSAIARAGSKDIADAIALMKRYFRLKPRRIVPDARLFDLLVESGKCQVFITKYKENIIGTCVCLFFAGNAYLWHLAARRKRYFMLAPATYTVWAALQYAYKHECRHMYFLDAGLPFKQSPMRELILNFGGKQVSEYRWFRIRLPLIGRLLDWLYNE